MEAYQSWQTSYAHAVSMNESYTLDGDKMYRALWSLLGGAESPHIKRFALLRDRVVAKMLEEDLPFNSGDCPTVLNFFQWTMSELRRHKEAPARGRSAAEQGVAFHGRQ